MDVKATRIPQSITDGAAAANDVPIPPGTGTWYHFVRGSWISRRQALGILIKGPRRGRINIEQSNAPFDYEDFAPSDDKTIGYHRLDKVNTYRR